MIIDDIVSWMIGEIQKHGMLYQYEAASYIEEHFGGDFIPYNDAGNPSIRKDVLKAFRKISEQDVVWERGERMWRKRERGDDPGRKQP